MNSFFEARQNFLYYHGVADKIRWVPEFIDAISGEIDEFETGRRTGGRILEIYTIRGRKNKSCGMGSGVLLGYRGIGSE